MGTTYIAVRQYTHDLLCNFQIFGQRVWGCVFSGWVGFGGVVVFRIMEISYVGVVLGSGTL